jgi:hypothetical protein
MIAGIEARPIGCIAKFETTTLTRLKLTLETVAKPLPDITIVLKHLNPWG